jgi:hypothetical protein
MIKKILTILLLLFGLNSFAITLKEINVNGMKVSIPVAEGFYMVDTSMPEIKEMFENMSPLGWDFIGGLIHEDDLISFFNGETPSFNQFVHLSTIEFKKSKNTKFSNQKFKKIVKILKRENKNNNDNLKKQLNSLFSYQDLKASEMQNTEIKNNVINISPVFEFLDNDDAYGATTISKRKTSIDGKVKKYDRITTTLYLRVKDRLVKANFYSYKNNSTDTALSEINAKNWLDTLISINNRKVIPSKKSSLSLFADSKKGLKWSNELLKTISNEINNETPYSIDSNTTIDSVFPLSNELLYKYSIKEKVEDVSIDYFKSEQSKNLINNYCTTPDLEIFRNLGVMMSHTYYDINGKFIAEFKIDNLKCLP